MSVDTRRTYAYAGATWARVLAEEAWMEDANCRGLADHWDLIPRDGLQARLTAQRVCLGCPVQEVCREYGMANRLDGVYGGVPMLGGRSKSPHFWPKGSKRAKRASIGRVQDIIDTMPGILGATDERAIVQIMEELSCQRKWARQLLRQALLEQPLE